MARVGNIKLGEDVNTDGISVSVYFTGCDFNCPNCFNVEFQDCNFGVEYTKKTEDYIFDFIKENLDFVDTLAILGGEPLHKSNYNQVLSLCRNFKEKFPNKDIWLWTGNLYEDVSKMEIFKYLDYAIDGRFIEGLKDDSLKYRGSSNQRAIDVQRSMSSGDILLLEE